VDLRSEIEGIFGVPPSSRPTKVPCPFHQDDTPSFALYDDHAYCFGCREYFSWRRLIERLAEDSRTPGLQVAAARVLERIRNEKRGRPKKRGREEVVLRLMADKASQLLQNGGVIVSERGEEIGALEFLKQERGHDENVIKRMRIGCSCNEFGDPELFEFLRERFEDDLLSKCGLLKGGQFVWSTSDIIFPVLRIGEPAYFRFKTYAAVAGDQKKRISQIPRNAWLHDIPLYNSDALYRKEVWITEGEDDVLQLEKAGLHAVAICGGVSRDKIKMLVSSRVEKFVIAVDNDDAGNQYLKKLATALASRNVFIYVPNEDIDKEIRSGLFSAENVQRSQVLPLAETSQGYFISDETGNHQVSNFTFSVIGEEIGDDQTSVLFLKIRPNPEEFDGREPFVVAVPAEEVYDLKDFSRFTGSRKLLWNLSSPTRHRQFIQQKLKVDDYSEVKAISYYGRADPSEIIDPLFLWRDCFMTSRGLQRISKEGFIVLEESDRIYLPTCSGSGMKGGISVLSKGDDFVNGDRTSISQICEGLNPHQLIAFAWCTMAPWYYEIQEMFGGFPLLWITGEQGAGKSTFARWLLNLFARKSSAETLFLSAVNTTTEGLARVLSNVSCLPVVLDDFREDVLRAAGFKNLMRQSYDRSKDAKGTIRGQNRLHTAVVRRVVRSPLLITSQSVPEDPALEERCVLVEFQRKERSPDQLKFLNETGKTLKKLGCAIIEESLKRPFLHEIEFPKDVIDRKKRSLWLIDVALRRLGISDEGIADVLENGLSEDDRSGNRDLDDFVSEMMDLYGEGEIEDGIHISMRNDQVWIASGQIFNILKRHRRPVVERITKNALGRLLHASGGEKQTIRNIKGKVCKAWFFDCQSEIGRKLMEIIVGGGESRSEEEVIFDNNDTDEIWS